MPSASFILKCESETGSFIIGNLSKENTVSDLVSAVKSKVVDIKPESLKLLYGNPLIALDLQNSDVQLREINIKDGDTLIVKDCPPFVNSEEGVMRRHFFPPKNSSIFDSLQFLLSEGEIDEVKSREIRVTLATKVTQESSGSAFGGMSKAEYVQWILNPNHWGAICELQLFSKHYKINVKCFVLTFGMYIDFGNDSFSKTVFMVCKGIHYNPLYYKRGNVVQTMFSATDATSLNMAREEARKYYTRRYVLEGYEDFNIVCLSCFSVFCGELVARTHTMETGHIDITEL